MSTDAPLHIVHVLNSTTGGSAESTLQLIEALAEQGVGSSLICHANGTAERQQEIRERLQGRVLFRPLFWTNRRIRAAAWKRPLIVARDWWQTRGGKKFLAEMAAFARQQGATHVHTSTLVNNEGAYLAQRLQLPHVWHGRELIGPKAPYRFRNMQGWVRQVQQGSQLLVANSRVTLDNYRQFFPEAQLWYWPNSIRVGEWSPQVLGHVPPSWRIGMVGNVTSRLKNHDLFIRMAGVLAKEYPQLRFKLYGALPPEADSYLQHLRKQIATLGLQDKAEFAGFARDPKQIMEQIDVMVHPTGIESFGRVVLEAMAAARPVVGVDGGGLKELIAEGETGYRIALPTQPDAQAEAFAAAVKSLIEAPEQAAAFGQAGRQRAQQYFDLPTRTQELVSKYRALR